MEDLPKYDTRNPQQAGVDVPNKEQFLEKLSDLLKENKGSELIGTFQAGCIPVILDTLARDTSEKGQKIVMSIYKIINDLKLYYISREEELVKNAKEDEVIIPVDTKPV